MSQTVSLHVPDMSCGHCKASVEGALRALSEVQSVSVDLASKSVQVQTAAPLAAATLVAALDRVGFAATPL